MKEMCFLTAVIGTSDGLEIVLSPSHLAANKDNLPKAQQWTGLFS